MAQYKAIRDGFADGHYVHAGEAFTLADTGKAPSWAFPVEPVKPAPKPPVRKNVVSPNRRSNNCPVSLTS